MNAPAPLAFLFSSPHHSYTVELDHGGRVELDRVAHGRVTTYRSRDNGASWLRVRAEGELPSVPVRSNLMSRDLTNALVVWRAA